MSCDDLISLLKEASWDSAIVNLRQLWVNGASRAREWAGEYGDVYKDQRSAMVFDRVMSRWHRDYQKVVCPLVDEFRTSPSASSLRMLAENGPGLAGPTRRYPFRRGEAETIRQVAAGLVKYCDEKQLDEEAGVRAPHSDRSVVLNRVHIGVSSADGVSVGPGGIRASLLCPAGRAPEHDRLNPDHRRSIRLP